MKITNFAVLCVFQRVIIHNIAQSHSNFVQKMIIVGGMPLRSYVDIFADI